MSAASREVLLPVLQPAIAQAIWMPNYRNARVHCFSEWFADNATALEQYWKDLSNIVGRPAEDYFVWSAIQHEFAMRETTRELP